MNDLEKRDQDVYGKDDKSVQNAKPLDIISKIEEELKNDPVYRIILKSDKQDQIFTEELKENIAEWRIYTTKDIEDILQINMATSNHWIKILKDYIQPTKVGKYNKITPIGLIRIRMIQILRENNLYSLSDLKNLILPEVIEEQNDNKSESIGEKVQRLEDEISTVKKQNELLVTILQKLVDPDSFNLENIAQGNIALNKELFTPLLEENIDKDKELLEKIEQIEKENKEIKEDVVKRKDLDEMLESRDKEMQKKWARANEAQLEELKQIYGRKKSFWERIFGK